MNTNSVPVNSHRARKRFGQNFLHDENIIARIVRAVTPRAGEHLIEIGPGQGALTQPLLEALGEAGQLSLIEIDRDLVSILEKTFALTANVKLIQADALSFDFLPLATNKQPLRIVGNLPYNISTPLLFHLLQQNLDHQQAAQIVGDCSAVQSDSAPCAGPLFSDMHFMLQQEVVQRICAEPGSKQYGRLSVMTQYFCQTESLFTVPPSAFSPQPKVLSAIVRLMPYQQQPHVAHNNKTFSAVVKTAFAQRRKTLKNNLRALIVDSALRDLDINPDARAETLPLADFVAISNAIDAN